jgi:hypothetical protein
MNGGDIFLFLRLPCPIQPHVANLSKIGGAITVGLLKEGLYELDEGEWRLPLLV